MGAHVANCGFLYRAKCFVGQTELGVIVVTEGLHNSQHLKVIEGGRGLRVIPFVQKDDVEYYCQCKSS